jgi:hypothetical protein
MEWRAIPGWPYEASDTGEVRNSRTGLVLRQKKNTRSGKAYLYVTLCDAPRKFGGAVHRLVLMAFDRMPRDGEEADHIDREPSNNRLENLRWLTVRENRDQRIIPRADNHRSAKLSWSDVVRIRHIDDPAHDVRLAELLGVSRETVRDARNGKQWRQ